MRCSSVTGLLFKWSPMQAFPHIIERKWRGWIQLLGHGVSDHFSQQGRGREIWQEQEHEEECKCDSKRCKTESPQDRCKSGKGRASGDGRRRSDSPDSWMLHAITLSPSSQPCQWGMDIRHVISLHVWKALLLLFFLNEPVNWYQFEKLLWASHCQVASD